MRILIVEDQENLANLVKMGLESEGFAADYVLDGDAGLRRILLNHADYDLIILDWMMPKKDGMEVCREVRAKGITTPIILLTAKDSSEDMVHGLDVGADDYLIKPFSFEVLLARIRALLRRPTNVLPTQLKVRDITLDPASKQVFICDQEVKLTLKEFSLLHYFMRHPNQVVGREQILASAWDFAFDSFSNVVDVHITNLRKKIGDKEGTILETVRGVGYKFNG